MSEARIMLQVYSGYAGLALLTISHTSGARLAAAACLLARGSGGNCVAAVMRS